MECFRCRQIGHKAKFCPKNSYQNRKKVTRKQSMNFESLANELLFNLFEYLSTADIICAFSNLNSRFNRIIFAHLHGCYLNFKSISKTDDLQTVCFRFLPSIAKRIVSIRISNERDYSKQNCLLAFYHKYLSKFTELQSITVCSLRSEPLMRRIMMELEYFQHLTHIKLIKCHSIFDGKDTTFLSNNIWTLSKLTHCYFDTDGIMFSTPTKTSSSIECLSIFGRSSRITDVKQILKRTPRLRTLAIEHRDLNGDDSLSSTIPLLTTLKLYDLRSRSVLMNLLQNMTNLHHLTVETKFLNLDGHQWEEIIDRYLPKLNIFRLKMQRQYTDEKNNRNQVDLLLDSFRTMFWLEKHQWFVRCHYKLNSTHSDILLYTLPNMFKNRDQILLKSPSKTTKFFFS